jgi:hypothetical protein
VNDMGMLSGFKKGGGLGFLAKAGKSKKVTMGEASRETERLSKYMREIFKETRGLRKEFTGQLEQLLKTGKPGGAQVPIIARALESTKRAGGRAMRGTSEQLESSGITGPFAQAILASQRGEQSFREGQIPVNIMQQMLAMIPGYLGQTGQTTTGGLGQAAGASAQTQAAATSAAGQVAVGYGPGACCFIFIAGHGFLHPIIRKYRDLKMNITNRRGYYILSDILVPLMKESRTIKSLVKLFMINPMTYYGKYYFGINKWGFIFAPISSFWLLLFTFLGKDKLYIRNNGELV